MNLVVFSGRAGKDPELMKGGGNGARFSIASGERYKDKGGEWQERTTWMNIQAWGKLADFVMKHVRKGEKVQVLGKLSVTEYNNKTYTSIIAAVVEPSVFHKEAEAKKPADDDEGLPFGGGGDKAPAEDDDDIPF